MIANLRRFFTDPTTRLAMTYVLIIMIMSLAFSGVLYHTSSNELARQLPPDSLFNDFGGNGAPLMVNHFFEHRIAQGRTDLLIRLLVLNIGTFCMGSLVSYLLARQALRPIEAAMEAQAQFVSDASHELRTPLTAMQTSNEVALRKPKLTLAEATQVIEQNTGDVKKLKELSDNLLSLVQQKKPHTKLEPVKLQEVASDALTQIVAQATAKDITVHDTMANLVVMSNHASLTQAMLILLDNAVKYSNRSGNIYLETQQNGKSAYVTIRDEGIGIRASDMPHLFRRFYRADNSRSGSERGGYGLGLAIAQQIIQSQNGEISALSTPDEGSSFTIKLPLAATA